MHLITHQFTFDTIKRCGGYAICTIAQREVSWERVPQVLVAIRCGYNKKYTARQMSDKDIKFMRAINEKPLYRVTIKLKPDIMGETA